MLMRRVSASVFTDACGYCVYLADSMSITPWDEMSIDDE